MSRDELTLWGKIKAKVQGFLDKFLRGLRIAKSMRLTDKDLSYILFKSWKHAKEGVSGHSRGVFAEAEDVVRKTGTRFSDSVREPSWKEKTRALTDAKKSPEDKTVALEDSPSRAEAPGYVPSLPEKSDTKIRNICENLKYLSVEYSEPRSA